MYYESFFTLPLSYFEQPHPHRFFVALKYFNGIAVCEYYGLWIWCSVCLSEVTFCPWCSWVIVIDLVSLWCHIVTAVKQQMTTGTLHCRKCILLYSATEYMAAKPAQVKNASTEKIRDLYSTRLLFPFVSYTTGEIKSYSWLSAPPASD